MAEWCRICGKAIDKAEQSHVCRDGRILNLRGGLLPSDLPASYRVGQQAPEVYRLEGQSTFEQLKPKPKRNRAAYMRSYRKGSKRGG